MQPVVDRSSRPRQVLATELLYDLRAGAVTSQLQAAAISLHNAACHMGGTLMLRVDVGRSALHLLPGSCSISTAPIPTLPV